jgi:CheY-like chemotaxis protein
MQDPSEPVVLVVDDDSRSRELMRIVLAAEGCRALLAADGLEALGMLQEHGPDMVLVDLRMPGMHGLEFCRRARAMHQAAAVPIVVLSGATDETSRSDAFAAGADAFLVKPMNRRALRECLSSIRNSVTRATSID